MNYTEQIFKMLNIEPFEEFKIKDYDLIYRINSNLIVECRKQKESKWILSSNSIRHFLTDTELIIKIPKPTKEDQIVINYARLCGYNWIAKDLGNNGHCFAYKEKPVKTNYGWDNQPIAKQPAMFLHYCLSCVSEDEPYCIKKENKED